MRTTLDLDDDVISAAKELARKQGTSLGQVISRLARQALGAAQPPRIRNGVPLLSPPIGRARRNSQITNIVTSRQPAATAGPRTSAIIFDRSLPLNPVLAAGVKEPPRGID